MKPMQYSEAIVIDPRDEWDGNIAEILPLNLIPKDERAKSREALPPIDPADIAAAKAVEPQPGFDAGGDIYGLQAFGTCLRGVTGPVKVVVNSARPIRVHNLCAISMKGETVQMVKVFLGFVPYLPFRGRVLRDVLFYCQTNPVFVMMTERRNLACIHHARLVGEGIGDPALALPASLKADFPAGTLTIPPHNPGFRPWKGKRHANTA